MFGWPDNFDEASNCHEVQKKQRDKKGSPKRQRDMRVVFASSASVINFAINPDTLQGNRYNHIALGGGLKRVSACVFFYNTVDSNAIPN